MMLAIIFDLDDVIVNSSPLHFKAYEKALKDFGIKAPEIGGELRRSIYGMRIKEIMKLLAREFNLDVDVEELTRHRDRYFMELVENGIEPMPGLNKLVKNIKKWGLKRAVASSGVRPYVEKVISQLGLSSFFDAIVTGDDVVKPKPDPEVFLKAAGKLDVEPSRCAVIEDAEKGIEAAKKAGMFAIGLKDKTIDSKQDLSRADAVVGRLDKITLEMLKKAS